MPDVRITSERELLDACSRLGADWAPELGARPRPGAGTTKATGERVAAVRRAVKGGEDPLGEAFCSIRSAVERRPMGATYTPPWIVFAMVQWAKRASEPARVVDPGTGSGRFLLEAGRAFPNARLIGVERDPVAATVARANICAAGLSGRAEVMLGDYRSVTLPSIPGQTLFIGNPPYVRHHEISAACKGWLKDAARERGLPVSQLAGLHLYFFLATLGHAKQGDVGSFITASEWLDVNYGALARALLSGPLGLSRLDLFEPAAMPFADAQTTAVIAGFRVGERGSVRARRVSGAGALHPLSGGKRVGRDRLEAETRWSPLFFRARARSEKLVELGELCRVHRGQVTGQNRVWIAGQHTPPLPSCVLRPAITRAAELFRAGHVLTDDAMLRRVIELPADLAQLDRRAWRLVDAFLRWARAQGAQASYIARHRSPWWAVRLRAPAPIVATYMARRPPAFVRNLAGAKHINIAHGLYPRVDLAEASLDALAHYLARNTARTDGRTYAGGLTKFEPREMERLLVPAPERLAELPPGEHAA